MTVRVPLVLAVMTALFAREAVAAAVGGSPPSYQGTTDAPDVDNITAPAPGESARSPLPSALRDYVSTRCEAQGVPDPDAFVTNVTIHMEMCERELRKIGFTRAGEVPLAQFISTTCYTFTAVVGCLETMVEGFHTCLNETERAEGGLDIHIAAMRAAVDHLCENDGDGGPERLTALFSEESQECLGSPETKRSITRCLLQGHDLRAASYESTAISDRFSFTPTKCHLLFTMADCTTSSLRHCENPTTYNVVRRALQAFERPLPCKRTTGECVCP